MKRAILILSVLLGLHVSAMGQYSQYYYHRTGDTIYQDSPIYYHSWWKWNLYRLTQEDAILDRSIFYNRGLTTLLPFHTADTLKIVGIAGITHTSDRITTHLDVLYLYDYDSLGNFVQRVAIPRDSNDDVRKIFISGNGWWMNTRYTGDRAWNFGPCCHDYPWDRVFPVFEYYFDSAIYVVDSFFVGNKGKCMAAQHHGIHYECNMPPYEQDCVFELQMHKIYQNSAWHYVEYPQAPMIWPIIAIDTTVPPPDVCLPVENLAVAAVDTFSVAIVWDTFPQYTAVEICYGAAGGPWSCVTVLDTNATTLSLPDTAQADYLILARAVCDSLKAGSPWSDTLRITLPRAPLACPPVEGFAVSAVDTFAATLGWVALPEVQAYELALFHNGAIARDTIYDTESGHLQLLLPDTATANYAAALRSLCDTATHEAASPWSDTLRFTLLRDTAAPIDSVGIAPTLAALIVLQPNPASGTVQVASPVPLLRAEVLSVDGSTLIDIPLSGTSATLDIAPLPAGIYLVVVHTILGQTTKRLAVY